MHCHSILCIFKFHFQNGELLVWRGKLHMLIYKQLWTITAWQPIQIEATLPLRSVKGAPNYYAWHESMRKHCNNSQPIAIVRGDWMAAACKLLSFASVILAVSPCCLALCYPWLWSRWVWLTKGMPLRPSAACFSEQERGICLELLERQWPMVSGGWCGSSDG